VLTTAFLNDAYPGGWQPPAELTNERLGAAGAAWFFAEAARGASDRPLDAGHSMRLAAPAGRPARCTLEVRTDHSWHPVELECLAASHLAWRVDGQHFHYEAEQGGAVLRCGPRRYSVRVEGDEVSLWSEGQWLRFDVVSALRAHAAASDSSVGADQVIAALPGIVTGLLVEVGQTVSAGTPVAILEAMKLIHTLCAPRDGVVASLGVTVGETIQGGTVLVRLAAQT
jgi:3-methylcrotonyl-CoA carboxylase alpha subunit